MKYIIIPILVFLANSCYLISPQKNWELIFEDNFSYNYSDKGFDSNKWSFCPRRSPEWCRYLVESNKTAFVNDGKLILRAIKNDNVMPKDTARYLTGGVLSRNKFSFKYGKIEVNAKLSKGQGSWPAIWLMPEDQSKGWPECGEIDIMEHLNHDNYIYQTVHSKYITTLGIKHNPKHSATYHIDVTKFNVYGIEWSEDKIDFTINGKITFTYPKIETDKEGQWPFNKPFYIILNQAGGGNWGGLISPEQLPFQMEVDWVKVYKKKE